MNYQKLKIEITTDPLVRGYSAMSDSEIAVDINTVYRTVDKATMTGSEVLNAIDKGEFNTLSITNKQLLWDILHIGNINPFGIEATLFIDIFGGASATIISLQALRKNNVSRAMELGIGKVREGHIILARGV